VPVDPYVQSAVAGTCGNLYLGAVGRLERYPIPAFPLDGPGRLLDVGCGWGRWSIAAARAGFTATGVDPDEDAIAAARRVARDLGSSATFVGGSADRLPFDDASFDVVFSFSVLQHLSDEVVERAFDEARRVLTPGGVALIELPNEAGVLARLRRLRAAGAPMRYYALRDLRRLGETIGDTRIVPDAFLSLNAQPADLDLLSGRGRAVVRASRLLVSVAHLVPPFGRFADSVFVEARRST
jgi:SAM-dependent methyltransferase